MTKNTPSPKLTDAEQVSLFMAELVHPMKKEMELVRKIIRSNSKLNERIKWNAPSYYYVDDIVTFGPVRKDQRILLVFHHPLVVKVKSALLEGNYKDRRLVYFDSMKAIKENKKELERILGEIVGGIDKKTILYRKQ